MKRTVNGNVDFSLDLSNKVNLKECFSLVCKQKANLSFEELLFMLSEIQEEIQLRTTVIRETIPNSFSFINIKGDVWMSIFNSLSLKEDLSFIMSLKSVCKHWNNVFSDCHLTAATFADELAYEWIDFVPNIRHLSLPTESFHLVDYFDEYWTNIVTLTICPSTQLFCGDDGDEVLDADVVFSKMTNLTKLHLRETESYLSVEDVKETIIYQIKNFTNLRKLTVASLNFADLFEEIKTLKYLKKIDIRSIRETIHPNVRQFLENLDQFSDITLPQLTVDYINCYDIQKKYPHIRFRWYIENYREECDIYEGEFNQKNEFEGKGTYVYGSTCKWKGEWKNGSPSGRGIEFTYSVNGTDIYEGEFADAYKSGKGIMYYHDRSRYEGEWSGASRSGKGVLYNSDGSINYDGVWSGDKREGKGICYYKNGDSFEGEFLSNSRKSGIYYHSDGGRYEGDWYNDKRWSKGIYYYPNGSKYVGEFRNDEIHRKGTYYYSDGSRYEGEWWRGERRKGIYYYADGSIYEGDWKRDKEGNYYFSDGSKCEREWKYSKWS